MKKLLNLIMVLSILCSVFGIIDISTYAATEYNYSFEGNWFTTGWGAYCKSYYESGVLGYSTNTDKSHITDGSQSLYLYDKKEADANSYAGISTPSVDITGAKLGEYTASVDAKILEGTILFQLRYYYADGTYEVKQLTLTKNSGFETYSIPFSSPYEAISMRVVIATRNPEIGVGYFDNLKIVKTKDVDQSSVALYNSVKSKLSSAAAGTTIEIDDGVYYDFSIVVTQSGAKDNPITIKAKNPGEVVFKGASNIIVKSSYVNIEGFRFEECTANHVVKFDLTSSYCQLKDCAIYNSSASYWVMLRGRGIRVSNCFFDKKSSRGQMLEVSKDASNENIPDDHIIENCFIGNIAPQSENGFEAIRIGSSTYCFSKSNTTVSGCFFYKCNGEVETISVKSCFNTIKNNTFYNNSGAIVLRHGDDNDVYGNLFIGGDSTTRPTGVRIIGERHKVHNNYFYNLPAKSQVILIYNGCSYENIENHYYYPVVDAKVYNNTIIGGNVPLQVGEYNPNTENIAHNRVIAPDGDVYNNAIVSYTGTGDLVANGDDKHTVSFSNNYAYGKAIGYNPDGIINEYFKLVKDGKYYKPEDISIGADLSEVKKAPVNPFDIVPGWVKAKYYDTGLFSFSFVANDPFNKNSHLNDVIPFEVSYKASGEDGILSLKKDGVNVAESKLLIYNNPSLEFTAVPGEYEKVSCWYVNGIPVTTGNMSALGVSFTNKNVLTINELTGKYDIEVEFATLETIADVIEAPVSVFKGLSDGNMTVKNHNDDTIVINGCYAAVGAKIPLYERYAPLEYGFLVSEGDAKPEVKAEAKLPLTSDGAYGILFYNFSGNRAYKAKPYVVYYDSKTKETVTIEGAATSIYVKY